MGSNPQASAVTPAWANAASASRRSTANFRAAENAGERGAGAFAAKSTPGGSACELGGPKTFDHGSWGCNYGSQTMDSLFSNQRGRKASETWPDLIFCKKSSPLERFKDKMKETKPRKKVRQKSGPCGSKASELLVSHLRFQDTNVSLARRDVPKIDLGSWNQHAGPAKGMARLGLVPLLFLQVSPRCPDQKN